ncbi:MAG: methyltransferase domain-containing protein [Acidobacteria bacterium]|nr:methyltransferase domain-containing protein [Acidobacteriota bacterium]
MIRKALALLGGRSPAGLLTAVGRRVRPRRVACYPAIADAIRGKSGLEIGGPSDIFAGHSLLPAYAIAGAIDNVNFSRATIWEGTIQEGQTFRYDARHAPGRQYILEATDLRSIPGELYDFILSSHTIEHVANPLRALREWVHTLKGGGLLVLVVPHHEGTFDHRRPVTPMAHLLDDERNGTTENDLTHLPEILELHDLSLDPPAGDFASFKARSERNAENRCLHHHVFDERRVVEMLEWLGTPVVAVERIEPYHIFSVARKTATTSKVSMEKRS